MKYSFNSLDKDIRELIAQINNIDLKSLDVSDFSVDYDLDILTNFRQLIASLKDKKFLIVGDYDCDGICATAIMKKLFDDLDIKNNYYIPSRNKEGYGISDKIVNMAIENCFEVVVMVDNGAIAYAQIDELMKHDIKTIVIDHHNYELIPNCDYFLHPNLFSDKYADMCASGLCALVSNSFRYDELSICLAGLATIADLVSVFNYNRYLIVNCIEIISKGNIYPINYLLGKSSVSAENLAYNVIPKINAVSRLDYLFNVNFMVKYMLADKDVCASNFDKIETINDQRKTLSKKMYEDALQLINEDDDFIVLASDRFIEGLCGLLANRLMSEFNKPVLVFAIVDNELRGSGRSLEGFDIHKYLSGCKDIFKSFGGHSLALGLSLDLNAYDQLIDYINSNPIKIDEPQIDAIVLSQDELNFDLYDKINSLQPFGVDFKLPLLAIENVRYENKFLISNKYPKFIINDYLSAISFKKNNVDKPFDYMIGKLNLDDYYKGERLSFVIEDLV